MVVVVNSIYNRTARRMLLSFSLLLDYNRSCLVKRSRALRGRNPTRNNQVRAGEWPAWPWRLTPPGLFFPIFIHLPCHPSENPGVWGRAPASLFRPQILRNSHLFMQRSVKCIDTGCGYGGLLTALDVGSCQVWQVDEFGRAATASSSHSSPSAGYNGR